MKHRSLLVTSLLALTLACGGGSGSRRLDTEAACTTSDDCPAAMLCRGGTCVDETGCAAAGTCDGDGDSSPGDGGDSLGGDSARVVPKVRFVAIGDTGKGNDGQLKVAQAIAAKCASVGGCDFGLLLGDNFYPSGVSSVTDEQWQSKFEVPYAGLSFPIYAVLGNHDYGADGAGTETWKGQIEVDYAQQVTTKFKMPSKFYTFTKENVGFVVIDTNSILFNQAEDQRDWYDGAVAALGTQWVFVAGHHPYRSNGKHGNAGEYDGLEWLPTINGEHVKTFYDDLVCGTNDFYLSGHDHNLQWLAEKQCGAELVVSGGGASATPLEGTNPTNFQLSDLGFFFAVIEGSRMTGQFYDANGALKYERVVTK